MFVSEHCFKAKDSCPAFIQCFHCLHESDFPSAVDISFLCDMAHKIICMSEKALPEDKSKIKFKFSSPIVLFQNKKVPWYQ